MYTERTWARVSDNGYEVSSKGDKRFSALVAMLKDGRTIEEAYQLDVKIRREVNTNYTFYSGGAFGSDSYFDKICAFYGILDRIHYYYGDVTPLGNTHITDDEWYEGQAKVTEAARLMGRIEPTHQVRDSFLIRNWMQVKNTENLYAIGKFIENGDPMKYGKTAKIKQVSGGTGYAVQMGIMEDKLVYFFDQVSESWFKYEGAWVPLGSGIAPLLSQRFTGIGTRELEQSGKYAIEKLIRTSITTNTWRDAKGLPSLNPSHLNADDPEFYDMDKLYEDYKSLWKQWCMENAPLVKELAEISKGKVLTEMFAHSPINQARVLTEILNELQW